MEDPVEQNLDWVNQSSLNPARGYNYPAALRSLMRQDPEIIMVGEIRDEETAEIAINAGMTGHLVISTLHSNTTSGTFARLINMDIEPFLLASKKGSISILIKRANVPEVVFECRVLITKCPVIPALMAISAVSSSRISPTMMISGS